MFPLEIVPVANPGADEAEQTGAVEAGLEAADLEMAGVVKLTEQNPLPLRKWLLFKDTTVVLELSKKRPRGIRIHS